MERKAFGKLADGEEATLYTISNTKGDVCTDYRFWSIHCITCGKR